MNPQRSFAMKYKTLGDTGLLVSQLCFNAMTFHERSGLFKMVGNTNQGEADDLVRACINHSINFFDTADVYSENHSEEMLGQTLKNARIVRNDVVIATKCYSRVGPGYNDIGASRKHI